MLFYFRGERVGCVVLQDEIVSCHAAFSLKKSLIASTDSVLIMSRTASWTCGISFGLPRPSILALTSAFTAAQLPKELRSAISETEPRRALLLSR